jgi:hypothetical protein
MSEYFHLQEVDNINHFKSIMKLKQPDQFLLKKAIIW